MHLAHLLAAFLLAISAAASQQLLYASDIRQSYCYDNCKEFYEKDIERHWACIASCWCSSISECF